MLRMFLFFSLFVNVEACLEEEIFCSLFWFYALSTHSTRCKAKLSRVIKTTTNGMTVVWPEHGLGGVASVFYISVRSSAPPVSSLPVRWQQLALFIYYFFNSILYFGFCFEGDLSQFLNERCGSIVKSLIRIVYHQGTLLRNKQRFVEEQKEKDVLPDSLSQTP